MLDRNAKEHPIPKGTVRRDSAVLATGFEPPARATLCRSHANKTKKNTFSGDFFFSTWERLAYHSAADSYQGTATAPKLDETPALRNTKGQEGHSRRE